MEKSLVASLRGFAAHLVSHKTAY